MNLYKYLITIHNSHLIKENNWVDSFTKEVGYSLKFSSDGQIWDNTIEPRGLYSFIHI